MKTIQLTHVQFKFVFLLVLFIMGLDISNAQQAEIVVFRHDLRWVDETKFPNYFLSDEVRDTIFNIMGKEIVNYLELTEIKLPENVSYKIINGFGKQKVKMPKANPKNDYEVGIYSLISRGTVGFSILWKFNIVIKKNGKVILAKEVVHELEYFNVSGYLTAIKWVEPDEFQDLFIRLLQESLGVVPLSDEVIIIGSIEKQEEKARAIIPESTRHLLKINGNWRNAESFVGQLESPIDTVLDFQFKERLNWKFPKPDFSDVLPQLFSEITGVELVYEKLVDREKKAGLVFSDGNELEILLNWIEIESRSTFSDEVHSQGILNPLVAELYTREEQTGYFVYTQEEIVYTTNKTERTLSYQTKNSLGIERIHRIEGRLNERPIWGEYNTSQGIIEVKSGEELLGVMVVQNLNPVSRSISKGTLSKKKIIMYRSGVGKSSLKKAKSAEWFPLYLPNGFSDESAKMCIETLILLFFGIGNM